MTVDQVVDLLEKEECTENAIQIFKTEHIDGKAFLLLKDKDLKELGLVMGDRLKIVKLLEDIHKEESGGVYVFIDNSNLWINAKTVAKQRYMITNEDHRVRIEIGKLTEYVSQGRKDKVRNVLLCGSRPPPADTIWKKMRDHGWDVVIKERSTYAGKEKGVDSQIIIGMLDVFHKQKPETISGDADMSPPIEYILGSNETTLEVYSWEGSLASSVLNSNAKIVLLDQAVTSITFIEWKFNGTEDSINRSGSTRVVFYMEPSAFPYNKPTDDWCRELDEITQWPFQYYWADDDSEDLVLVFRQENYVEFNREDFLQKINVEVGRPINNARKAMLHKDY